VCSSSSSRGNAPGHLLRLRVDLDDADEAADRLQHLACHVTHGSIGAQGDAVPTPVAVLSDRLVTA
jgi:hypothetical protein